jgi:hypothetical protein
VAAYVLLAYLDSAHGDLAKSYWDQLSHDKADFGRVVVSEWNFDMLNNRALMPVAAAEAEQASLVVIATESTGGLPNGVRSWFESWCSTKPSRHAVVAILLSEHSGFSAGHCPDYPYLETHTAVNGRRLIAYATGWTPDDGGQFCLAAARLVTPAGLVAVEKFPELAMLSGNHSGK